MNFCQCPTKSSHSHKFQNKCLELQNKAQIKLSNSLNLKYNFTKRNICTSAKYPQSQTIPKLQGMPKNSKTNLKTTLVLFQLALETSTHAKLRFL